MGLIQAAADVADYTQRELDRLVPPESREKAYSNVKEYATRNPFLFSFAAAQLLFAALPIFIFLSFIISTILFSFGCAVLFTLFWIFVALCVLVPALLIGATVSAVVWASIAACFIASSWGLEVVKNMADAAGRELGDPDAQRKERAAYTPEESSTPAEWAEVEGRDVKSGAGVKKEGGGI